MNIDHIATLRIDLATGNVMPLPPPAGENAASIDGLYWQHGALIGIQNVTTPARVVGLALTSEGRKITDVKTLQSHHHRAFGEPTTTAAIVHGALYVLARTQVAQFSDSGTIDRRATLRPPLILRVR